MLSSFIVLFREVLEMAVILTIILAATRGARGRGRWVWIGIAGGVLGSAVVAAFADTISDAMEGVGQEYFNAAILLVAVGMIGWTVVWMKSHGRHIAQKIRRVGEQVVAGELPMAAIATIVALSMWREGAEVVLFMTGILSTSNESIAAIITGAVGGAAAAGAIGTLLYFGLIKLSTKYLFSVTSWLLVLLCCGMSAQAAGYLIAAGALPELISPLWDTGWLLSEQSVMGKILHSMLGYTERPSGMQAVWYLGTLAIILSLLNFTRQRPAATPAAA